MLVTSIFSFSHSVFTRLLSQGCLKSRFCGNYLKHPRNIIYQASHFTISIHSVQEFLIHEMQKFYRWNNFLTSISGFNDYTARHRPIYFSRCINTLPCSPDFSRPLEIKFLKTLWKRRKCW